jgi:hypothetical protein
MGGGEKVYDEWCGSRSNRNVGTPGEHEREELVKDEVNTQHVCGEHRR